MIYQISDDNSIKQYGVAFKKWFNFCKIHNIDTYEASTPEIIFFLTKMFHAGIQYGSLNSYRSALSLIIVSTKIGSDDRITRLFRGFYRLRPPLPKNITWNPMIVLNFLENSYPHDYISIETLTKKVVTLLALVTAHRVQTLSKIKIQNIEVITDDKTTL